MNDHPFIDCRLCGHCIRAKDGSYGCTSIVVCERGEMWTITPGVQLFRQAREVRTMWIETGTDPNENVNEI